MSPLPSNVELTPDAPGVLTAGRFRLEFPKDAVGSPVTARLAEEAPAAALPPDYRLRAALNLSIVAGYQPPDTDGPGPAPAFRFREYGTLSFTYDGLEDVALPATALQVRMLSRKSNLWVEVPATVDHKTQAVSVTIWSEGVYVLVANAGMVPLAPVRRAIGKAGGSLDFARLHLEFPAGCFDEDTEVTVGPPAPPVASWQGALPFPFEIQARRVGDGQEISQLGAPLRMAVSYHDAEVGNRPADHLTIRHFDRVRGWWEPLPTAVDATGRLVTAETSHLSTYVTGGSQVEQALNFGADWVKPDPFTGNVSFSAPFELPPGPGGLAPNLRLVYSSQSSHQVQRSNHLSNVEAGHGQQTASWVGEGFDIPIGYVQSTRFEDGSEHWSVNIFGQGYRLLQDGTGKWRTQDEQFWKIDRNGTDINGVSYLWRVITPEGTKYYFGTDSNQTDRQVHYDYGVGSQMLTRAMLSRVEDTSGNLITITYERLTKLLSGGAAMTPAVYPTQIRYGGRDAASLPYAIAFNRSGPPLPNNNTLNGSTGVDRTDVNVPDWIVDQTSQTSFDVKYLDSIDVLANGSLARRYKFSVSPWSIPLMLLEVSLWSDANGTMKQSLFKPTYTPTPMQLTDYRSSDNAPTTNDYQFVISLANGFGGRWDFAYADEAVASFQDKNGPSNVLYNGRALVMNAMTANPGFGGNSMVVNHTGYTNPLGNNNPDWPDFWGHSQVTVSDAGSQTVMWFGQGWLVGRSLQTNYKDLSGNVWRWTVNTWGITIVANASIWVHLDQTYEYQQSARKTINYSYATSEAYGNLLNTYEYEGDPATANWIRHTKRWFYPVDQSNRYIVNKPGAENVYSWDGTTDGAWQRSTWYCYDGSWRFDNPIGSGQNGDNGSYRGLLSAVRRNKGDGNFRDTTYGHDQWGNRTSATEWNSYGTSTALANADGRTNGFDYDSTYHAYKTSETNAKGHVTTYVWDFVKTLLMSTTDPNAAVTAHAYDALGRRTATWLPGDDPNQAGAATITYRYLIGGQTPTAPPTRVQVGRRKDGGGGSFGRRAYEWRFYDGLGRLIQTQADFDRSIQKARAQDVNELCTAVGLYTAIPSFYPVTTGVTKIQANHFVELRDKIQTIWNSFSLGAMPNWSSGIAPGGPSLSTNPTPIFGSDLVDLRSWLNFYQSSRGYGLSTWSYDAGKVIVVNRFYSNRGLLDRESVPHLLTLKVPGQFASGDWSPGVNPATAYAYDALKRTVTRTNPDNNTSSSWSYDGWSTTAIDERGHKKVFANDALGRLVKVKEYSGAPPNPYALYATTSYAYNVADQLVKVYDATCHDASGNLILPATGNVTTINYDKLGRKTDMTDPDMGYWTYLYYPIGTLSDQTDARNQSLHFDYDVLDRLLTKRNLGTTLAEFIYDELGGSFAGYSGLGRRTTMKFGPGLANTVKSYYDRRGRVVKADHLLDGVTYTIQATYDALDRILTVTHPNLEVVTYKYGDHGLPVSLQSSVRGVIVSNATYNPLGKLFDLALGNGLVSQYRYWGIDYGTLHYGMLRSINSGGLQSLTYGYDAIGNVSSLDDNNGHAPPDSLAFAYDHLDRLLSVSGGIAETYQYNSIGNLTSKGGVSYGYPGAGSVRPHAPTTVGGQSYAYDNDGNLTNAESRIYAYDVENRLTSATGVSPNRSFLYDGDGALRRMDVDGAQTTRYVTPDYQINIPTGEATVYYRFGGRVVAWRNNTVLRYLLADHLSSTRGEANEAGGEAAQRRYLPFGGDRPVAGANDLTRDERYTGQKRIDNGGGNVNRELYHYGARWYLPGVGIFGQPDSIVPEPNNPQALNRYSYCLNNPVKYLDPSGHARVDYYRQSLQRGGWWGGGLGGGDWLGPLLGGLLALAASAQTLVSSALFGSQAESRSTRGPHISREWPPRPMKGQFTWQEGLYGMFFLADGASLPPGGGRKPPKRLLRALVFLASVAGIGYVFSAIEGRQVTNDEFVDTMPPEKLPGQRSGDGPFIILSGDSPEVKSWLAAWQLAHEGQQLSMEEFDNWAWSLYFLQINGREPSQEDWEKHYYDSDYTGD